MKNGSAWMTLAAAFVVPRLKQLDWHNGRRHIRFAIII